MSSVDDDGDANPVGESGRPGSDPEHQPALWQGAAEAPPGMARTAGTVAVRSTVWTLGAGLRSGRLLARTLTDRDAAGELVQGVARDVAEASRRVGDVARAVSHGVPVHQALLDASVSSSSVVLPDTTPRDRRGAESDSERMAAEKSLRAKGEELIRRSRDVWSDEPAHPAYSRILEELAPDEARVLLLLLRGGPQPSVDVRTGGPVGLVSSSLVAPGMSMIGARAGCRHLEEVPSYLNNLFRLGLIWFSHEQLEDPMEYQVLEAQPDVLEALHSVRFAKVVRRSIHLTPFGAGFCRACLVDVDEEQDLDLPLHRLPEE